MYASEDFGADPFKNIFFLIYLNYLFRIAYFGMIPTSKYLFR